MEIKGLTQKCQLNGQRVRRLREKVVKFKGRKLTQKELGDKVADYLVHRLFFTTISRIETEPKPKQHLLRNALAIARVFAKLLGREQEVIERYLQISIIEGRTQPTTDRELVEARLNQKWAEETTDEGRKLYLPDLPKHFFERNELFEAIKYSLIGDTAIFGYREFSYQAKCK